MAQDSMPKGGWHSGRFAHTFAAIDLGTNNCRLLVARASISGFEVLDAYSRPVRLGEGVALNGALCGDAIERTLEALGVCATKIERHRVTRARHIATEACRRACNGQDFLALVRQRTGLDFELIPPREEARLALSSCESLLDPDIPYGLLVDIGGGSTEVCWVRVLPRKPGCEATTAELIDMTSVPWGVVTLTEACARGQSRNEPLGHGRYMDMVERIGETLRPFCARHNIGRAIARGDVQMVGASGTVTTFSAHHLGLKRYHRGTVDGSRLSRESILAICKQLAGLSVADLRMFPCIGDDRADLALAGGAILEAVCRQWPAPVIRVADRGLREGVLMDLMRQADREADFLCRTRH
ncbi:exopolyphosphatase / guanosine-5'-triphosphate,3'-diphosphate pyrophosphatase [Enhydrobacter aerosaccus]|uniref:Exopolyphosphatase / guanosine-5'-triphosphate,3'-diphosphate pyrophosphatase n=1 Tax=Enhydrobacter aerosaccus TaxID=225324 RepID=A0A1T4M321_9HYPH|nr:Ppx/GppA phosphatase family protein [Enhydrobacter aerosaccus]SJZ61342.1 exopolyphosphatase / guanosine-5'-triphosphate,3'-diphosphate pyrophosphatase [Enhydrobacter aerosaccus]